MAPERQALSKPVSSLISGDSPLSTAAIAKVGG